MLEKMEKKESKKEEFVSLFRTVIHIGDQNLLVFGHVILRDTLLHLQF